MRCSFVWHGYFVNGSLNFRPQVGWVLGEMDALAEQLAAVASAGSRGRGAQQRDRHSGDGGALVAVPGGTAAAHPEGGLLSHSSDVLAAVEAGMGLGSREPPPPPPVAVLPLGTGMDALVLSA